MKPILAGTTNRAKFLSAVCLLWLASCCAGTVARAQSNFGSLRGQVRDATGAAIPGATLRITDAGTNATTTIQTSADGSYVAPSLRPVTYLIKVEATGFKAAQIANVKIDTAKDSNLDFTLQTGEVSDTVTITTEAPLVQTETGVATRTVDQRTILEVPLNGRNTLELALTLPGMTGSAGSEFADLGVNDVTPGRELSGNGGRPGSTQFFADGASTTSVALARTSVSFTPDTIQEFSVQSSNFSAKYGQAGGAIIQQTTKSGTNDFHGTGYWFHRQKALTASPFGAARVATLNNDPRGPFRRQQIGGTIGGPLVLPRFGEGGKPFFTTKNRTFFFFAYEPTRQIVSSNGPTFERVPTELELNGDFSQSFAYLANGTRRPYAPLFNQFNRLADGTLTYRPNPTFNANLPESVSNARFQFSGFPLFDNRGTRLSVGGVSYVNPIAQRIARELYPRANLAMIETPNDPNIGTNYVYFRRTQNRDNRYSLRLDHRLNDNHLVYGRWSEQPFFGNRYFRDPLTSGLNSENNNARQILVAWQGTLSPRMSNELRLNYTFGDFSRTYPSPLQNYDQTSDYLDKGGAGAGRVNTLGYGGARFFPGAAPNGFNGTFNEATGQFSGVNQAGTRNYGSLGFNSPQDVGKNTEHTYAISDDLTWVRDKHTLGFGFAGSLLMLNQANAGVGNQAGGRFAYNNNITANQFCAPQPFAGAMITGCNPTQTIGGDQFASFLLGVPEFLQMQTENASNPFYYRWYNYALYVQDDWRVRDNLTLNLGLRYQFQSPRWEKFNLQGKMNLQRLEANPAAVYNAATGAVVATPGALAPVFEYSGIDGRSRYMVEPQRFDFEPRLGFAWVPKVSWNKSRQFVIRGGYGISHTPLTGNDRATVPSIGGVASFTYRQYGVTAGNTDANAPTNQPTCGLAICQRNIPLQFGFNNYVITPDPSLFRIPASGVIRPGDLVSSLSLTPNLPRNDVRYNNLGFLTDPEFQTPTVQSYSLQTEYEFMRNTVLRIGYQGSRGTHLLSPYLNYNQIDPFTGRQAVPGYSGRAQGQLTMLYRTGSASTYHGALAEVERRFSRGLQFRFNYTLSKSLDDNSGGINFDVLNQSFNNSGNNVLVQRQQDPLNSRAERAVSSFDNKHVFNLTTLYELPFGKGKWLLNRGGWVNQIVGGWQLSGVARANSGFPVFVTLGAGNSVSTGLTGIAFRPNLIDGVPLKNPDWTPQNSQTVSYLNPRAFAWPEPGKFGNAPRNLDGLRTPWNRTVNTSLMKRFPFGERSRALEFRVEVFNLFNHKILSYGGAGTNLFGSGNQNLLLSQTTGQPNANVRNRYANLTAPGVWEAILANRLSGANIDAAIANLPGLNGQPGCPRVSNTNAELSSTTGTLSPACAAFDLAPRFNANFYRLNQNGVAARTFQLGVKFYF